MDHYNCYPLFPFSPYAAKDRTVIEQRDGHWTNETLAQSQALLEGWPSPSQEAFVFDLSV